MYVLATNMNLELGEEEAYEELAGTLSDIVKDAGESVEAVADEVYQLLQDNGLSVSTDLVESFSESLIETVKTSDGELTAEGMETVISEFAVKYADRIGEIFPDGIPDHIGDVALPDGL